MDPLVKDNVPTLSGPSAMAVGEAAIDRYNASISSDSDLAEAAEPLTEPLSNS